MADPFEIRLQRLFAETPPRPDAELFALQVRERLERAWTLRRLLIGLVGAAGGSVALWQLAGSAAVARVEAVARLPSMAAWRDGLRVLLDSPALRLVPFSGEIMWMAGGLLLLAAGLAATRWVDEL